jgi:glutamyl-tRNA synthetase
VHIWEYSRLNLEYTTLSKRKLQWFVDEGHSTGWDDPRFPTVQGVTRRGLKVEALKEFMLSQGASKNCNLMEWTKIWAMNKKIIDPIAPRHVCVADEDRVVVNVLGFPDGEHWYTTPKHKKNPDVGIKVTLRMKEILLEQADAQLISEGEECTLMDWGNAIFKNIVKEGDVVKSMDCEINPEGDVKSTKLKLTWLANWKELVPVIMKDFDYLITKRKPEETDEFKDIVNKTTEIVTVARGDGNLRAYNKGEIIQIERKGYFIVDRVYVNEAHPMILLNIPDGKKASWGVGAK